MHIQGGKFDHADRLFSSLADAWESASKLSMSDVKELTPGMYVYVCVCASKLSAYTWYVCVYMCMCVEIIYVRCQGAKTRYVCMHVCMRACMYYTHTHKHLCRKRFILDVKELTPGVYVSMYVYVCVCMCMYVRQNHLFPM